jgi:hypothetical protein
MQREHTHRTQTERDNFFPPPKHTAAEAESIEGRVE